MQLNCTESSNKSCIFTIDGTTFNNNSAGIQGGAISYNQEKPLITSNVSYIGNTAIYGPNIASYSYKIVYDSKSVTKVWSG